MSRKRKKTPIDVLLRWMRKQNDQLNVKAIDTKINVYVIKGTVKGGSIVS